MSTNAKRAALRLIRGLPADASLEDIQYLLYLGQRVERGLGELRDGKTVTQEQVERSLRRWRRSKAR
ncbi:MAG: hypothetical protein HZA54_06255 [Planctomycetes bacterium]|nr:hypothetical protein [Planctomycetota bacterium]